MMAATLETSARPWAITIICVIGFIGVAFSVPQFFSPAAQEIGAWYLPYLGFSVILGLACMLGLWRMKKWAAYTYTGFVVLNQLVLYTNGLWNVHSLVLPLVVVLFILKYVAKMD